MVRGSVSGGFAFKSRHVSSSSTNVIVYGPGNVAYMCRAVHTSTADDEPGVGVNWRDYWTHIGQEGLAGNFTDWVVATDYVLPTNEFAIAEGGEIWTNQTTTNTNTLTLTATVKDLEIFDENGVSLGYIPIFDNRAWT